MTYDKVTMKCALVTGATGFVGLNLCDRLLSDAISIHIFTRRRTYDIDGFATRGAKIFQGNFTNESVLQAALEGVDTIFHVAGAVSAVKKDDYFVSNTDFTSAILKYAKKSQRFILVSSLAAAGPSMKGEAITEEMEPHPITYYGESKLAAENIVKHWGKEHDHNFFILRPAVVFGPQEKNVLHFFKMISKGWRIILGTGEKKVSLIYIEDLIAAMVACANTEGEPGKTFFVCNDHALTWNEFTNEIQNAIRPKKVFTVKVPEFLVYPVAAVADLIAKLAGKPLIINSQKILEMKQPAWVCSNQKLKHALHWQETVSVGQAMAATARWYNQQGWI
jgi:nucleoside-diphosphate-sugar epimerase